METTIQKPPSESRRLSERDIPLRTKTGSTRKDIRLEDSGCNGQVPVPQDSTDPKTGEVESITAYKSCDQKGCPDCGPHLRRCFEAHHIEQQERKVAESGPDETLWFLTLTTKHDLSGTLGERLEALAQRRKKYFQKLRYRASDLSYLWVAETGDRQRAHLHLLICADLSREQLKNSWMKVGGGMINHVKRVTDQGHLVSTVCYMSKEQFCDPSRGETGFPGHKTNGHSRDIDGYASREAKEIRSQHAREIVVQKLLREDLEDRPVCDEKALRMYLRRILPGKVGEEVTIAGGGRGRLVDWERDRAIVDTGDGKKWVGAYRVFPTDETVPRVYEGTAYGSPFGGPTGPGPEVEPAEIPGSESVFRFEDDDGSVHRSKGKTLESEDVRPSSSLPT
jgi:hypothetical protein